MTKPADKRAAELAALRVHEDAVTTRLDGMPRIEQLIALRYLRALLGVAIEDTGREIAKDLRKEMA